VEHALLPATIRLIAAGRVKPPLPGTRVVQVDLGEGGAKDDAAVSDDGAMSSGGTT
jgi:hypothetical protein